LRRLTLVISVAAALAVPASASAQLPLPPATGTTPTPTPTPLARPNLKVAVASGLHLRGGVYTLVRDGVHVVGRANAALAGETVRVELRSGGKVRGRNTVRIGRNGRFAAHVRPRGAGRYRIRAVHDKSAKGASGASNAPLLVAIRASMRRGSGGIGVRLLQHQLAVLHYAVPQTGRIDDATARAVLAYRKVNRMAHNSHITRAVVRRLLAGKGTFRLRYPNAGKHVEADLTRQVVVLADHGVPFRIFHMSSGKASTPTITGVFRFYRKTPGYNSEGMFYSNYFIRGYAVHGYHSVPAIAAASHGCIRVPIASAISIYRWIDIGNRIFVYGHA
jgi:hypothetical protein